MGSEGNIPKDEWFLLAADLPNLDWARLRVFGDGSAQVFDLNGTHHGFATEHEARDWLGEKEYEPLAAVAATPHDGLPAALATVRPPEAPTDDALRDLMYLEWSEGEWRVPPGRGGGR